MKNKVLILVILLVLALGGTGALIYRSMTSSNVPAPTPTEEKSETLPEVDPAISISLYKSKVKDNAVVLSVTGLASNATIEYEISYETKGLRQGVSANPIDVSGKSSFEREIYLGTCSRNVCTPHLGVKTVSVVLVFTDTSGQKSQFSKDFDL